MRDGNRWERPTTRTHGASRFVPRAGGEAITNKVYVTNWQDTIVTVISGATNATTTCRRQAPWAVAVNAVTNKHTSLTTRPNMWVIDGASNDTDTLPRLSANL